MFFAQQLSPAVIGWGGEHYSYTKMCDCRGGIALNAFCHDVKGVLHRPLAYRKVIVSSGRMTN